MLFTAARGTNPCTSRFIRLELEATGGLQNFPPIEISVIPWNLEGIWWKFFATIFSSDFPGNSRGILVEFRKETTFIFQDSYLKTNTHINIEKKREESQIRSHPCPHSTLSQLQNLFGSRRCAVKNSGVSDDFHRIHDFGILIISSFFICL